MTAVLNYLNLITIIVAPICALVAVFFVGRMAAKELRQRTNDRSRLTGLLSGESFRKKRTAPPEAA
jgi:hypothetical protein